MKLAQKRAVVTGAGAGIGKAIAVRFAAEGARVVVNDLRKDAGESTVAAIRKSGGNAEFVGADCSREAEVKRMIDDAAVKLGGLDVIVNNAGIEIIKPVVQLTEEEWDRLMAINVKGVFFGCKHAIPVLEKSGGGAVINMASAAGLIGWPLLSLYCASKGAVVQFTRALAQEYKATKIRFNAICPMVIQTDMGKRFVDRYEKDFSVPVMAALEARQGRLGTVEEVAAAAVFLASDDASFVNGHALPIDNGGVAG
jgi:NAD(P)-dependent dehydrogenase (short-subunit alcohol dehydrogenase family)